MVIYLDITIFNNFLMTSAIIWAIANILEIKIHWGRLILAATIANIYFLLFLYLQVISLNTFLSLIIHILINLISALLIIKISFPDLSTNKFIKAVGYLYLVTFIAIGTTLFLFYVHGGSPFEAGIQKLLAGILVLFLLGRFGWRIFRNYKLPKELLLPIKINLKDNYVSLIGLIDTGNSLTDPITNVPVIVVNLIDILSLFPKGLQEDMSLLENDYIELIKNFESFNLAERIRILPFSDLGQENGILFGFRPDLVEIFYQSKDIEIKRCVIALSKRKLDIDNEYQALIHPHLVKVDS